MEYKNFKASDLDVILSSVRHDNITRKQRLTADIDGAKVPNNENMYADYSEAINVCKKRNGYLFKSNSLNNAKPIFTINPHKSRNNILTTILSMLPSWKNWPKRNGSIIFNNDEDDVNSYIDYLNNNENRGYDIYTYYIFPKNGSRVVVCPETSMLDSFVNVRKLPELCKSIPVELYKLGQFFIKAEKYPYLESKYTNYLKQYTSYKDVTKLFIDGNTDEILRLFKVLETLSRNAEVMDAAGGLYDLYRYVKGNFDLEPIVENSGTFLHALDDYKFNAKKNGFNLTNISNIGKYLNSSAKEMYTDSPCLLVLDPEYYADKFGSEHEEEYLSLCSNVFGIKKNY
jgi:hypothetical protein